ncbi:dCTP deaminase (plasmid) [Microtetraspora malaysiensis]|uniref:dCTP deaminase n=1 Tax=Microtetraspora malaysiensis TaxID=161358 RepID=UPI003D8F5A59
MLTAGEIAVQIRRGEIAWPGELRGDALLLRLGSPIQPLTATAGQVVDLANQDSIDAIYDQPQCWDSFDLAPGCMALCAVGQPLRLGTSLAACIGTLSHLARVGLATHITSPWVMPGWDGHLTLELLNVGPAILRLRRGMPVARALVLRMSGAVREALPHPHYGEPGHLGSRYATEFADQMNDQAAALNGAAGTEA